MDSRDREEEGNEMVRNGSQNSPSVNIVTTAATNNDGNNPDADTIKMFVGQIPKNWDEAKLREFFEQYGSVYHLNILKDKETETSRGCCFVTFYHRKDAINAQNVLHNLYTMPGLNHPVQMKPADVENRNERKLFIGMLSKTMNEEDVRHLFIEFGQIEDCSILREEGKSKGCAFLTFVNRPCAHLAIKKMNQSQIFKGCTKPMVVKFADAGRDKTFKKPSEDASKQSSTMKVEQPAVGQSGVEVLSNLLSLLQQPGVISLLDSARILQQLQMTQPTSSQENAAKSMAKPLPTKNDMTSVHAMQPQGPSVSPIHLQPMALPTSTASIFNLPHTPGMLLHQPALVTSGSYFPQNPNTFCIGLPNLMVPALPSGQQYGNAGISPRSLLSKTSNANGPSRGPEGCNLFIYHLPQEFTDADLYSIFSQFGSILSAKVFIDKQTNLSKCFGFVSYNDEASAQCAISGMNGVQVGNKRLKVQLKRSDQKPYDK